MNQTELVHQEVVRIHAKKPPTVDLTDRQYVRRVGKIEHDVKHITGRIAIFIAQVQKEFPGYIITMSPDG